MPIMGANDRKSLKGRLLILGIYTVLTLGSLTMVCPFLIMVTGSTGSTFDVERRSVLPRWIWSGEDRFMRMMSDYFPPAHRSTMARARAYFGDLPEDWRIWSQIGDEVEASDRWAQTQIEEADTASATRKVVAADYLAFTKNFEIREMTLSGGTQDAIPFLRDKYKTLEAFNDAWEMHIDDFTKIKPPGWGAEPFDLSMYLPSMDDTRYTDLLEFKESCRQGRYHSHLGGPEAPALHVRPASLAWTWEEFAAEAGDTAQLPFPVPADADPKLRKQWDAYLLKAFPLRHVAVAITTDRSVAFQKLLKERFRTVDYLNKIMPIQQREWVDVEDWNEVPFTETAEESALPNVWMDFIRREVPRNEWRIRDTLPEKAFQTFVLEKHGSLEAINKAYGLELEHIEQLRIPFRAAVLETFRNREWSITFHQIGLNYAMVYDYLFRRGRAVSNTIILVVLTIIVALTVNPLAGYALSRFQLPQTQKVIVFCLATTAFPAAVAAIPGFLLLRDLGLLNTFAALVLPTAANGMTIFLLKGFFDSLPKELYEAATIDGANELQTFWLISLPLVKPILAVGVLNAFIQAYNGWAWAILVCQDSKMWTLAVWTYQFYQTQSSNPAAVMAAFLINSLPVFVVFISCQKIILRGIILPTMK